MENPTPKLYEAFKLSDEEERERKLNEFNNDVEDPIDQLEVFELVRHLNDPEYPLTLEQLNVINL